MNNNEDAIITNLCTDVFWIALEFSNLDTLYNVMLTCKIFFDVANHNFCVWKIKCQQYCNLNDKEIQHISDFKKFLKNSLNCFVIKDAEDAQKIKNKAIFNLLINTSLHNQCSKDIDVNRWEPLFFEQIKNNKTLQKTIRIFSWYSENILYEKIFQHLTNLEVLIVGAADFSIVRLHSFPQKLFSKKLKTIYLYEDIHQKDRSVKSYKAYTQTAFKDSILKILKNTENVTNVYFETHPQSFSPIFSPKTRPKDNFLKQGAQHLSQIKDRENQVTIKKTIILEDKNVPRITLKYEKENSLKSLTIIFLLFQGTEKTPQEKIKIIKTATPKYSFPSFIMMEHALKVIFEKQI